MVILSAAYLYLFTRMFKLCSLCTVPMVIECMDHCRFGLVSQLVINHIDRPIEPSMGDILCPGGSWAVIRLYRIFLNYVSPLHHILACAHFSQSQIPQPSNHPMAYCANLHLIRRAETTHAISQTARSLACSIACFIASLPRESILQTGCCPEAAYLSLPASSIAPALRGRFRRSPPPEGSRLES